VEAQDPDVKPASEHLPGDHGHVPGEEGSVKPVTTEPRKALKVPDTVHVKVTTENLKDYVGPAIYHKDRLYVKAPPAGVSTGLGYLGNGSGAVMPVEATVSCAPPYVTGSALYLLRSWLQAMPGKGNLQLTGKLGEVIRESAQIALSWVKANAYALGITKNPNEMTLNDRDVHLHVSVVDRVHGTKTSLTDDLRSQMPEGGIGKEGPSAGTAILTAFVSLFTRTKIHPDIGESKLGAWAVQHLSGIEHHQP
jgi:Lon-like ATP-dependent protease